MTSKGDNECIPSREGPGVGSPIPNISDYLRINAEKFPDKPGLLYPKRITYRELELEVNKHSHRLSMAGLRPGTLTLALVPASPEFFILAFSIIRIGAVPVLIDPGMGIKAMSKALAGLKPEAFIGSFKAHLLRFLCPGIFKTVKVRIITGLSGFTGIKNFLSSPKFHQQQYSSYLKESGETAAIFFTSGSTGAAKGVVYTAGMLAHQVEVTKLKFEIGTEENDLCTFPLLGLFAICHGNSSVLADMNMMHPAKLNPARIIKNIQDFECTQMFGSPMILKKLSDYGGPRGIRFPSLLNIISAGAPVHQNILEAFSRMVPENAKIHTPYGATEALPVTDITASELFRIYANNKATTNNGGICVGYPVKGLEVKIIEINNQPVRTWVEARLMKENEVGEIVVKGPWVTGEYLKNPEANVLSKIPDQETGQVWHRMGDLGSIDPKGRIWFYGRKSHMVVTADGPLFTIPCEAVYNHHPSVNRSALVGIPGNNSGIKKPVICIQLKSGIKPSKKLREELNELGKSSLMTKGINGILFRKEFPVDPRHNAKIFREKLALWASRKNI